MTIYRDGVQMCPTNVVRLGHLNMICNSLREVLNRDLKMLEIGSLLGDSAKILARHGHVTCVDLWDYDMGLTNFINSMKGLNYDFIQGSSVDVLPSLPTNEYDLVYIDGDHTYPIVLSDMIQAQRLVTHEGIICGDDLEQQIMTSDGVWESRFTDYVDEYHPGVSLAIYEVFGWVEMRDGFWWWQNEP